MDIKLTCVCGQRYAFEVTPVNGTLPCRVACPRCGVDGTGAANGIIAERLAATPPVTVLMTAKLLSGPGMPAVPEVAVPAPVSPSPAATPPPPAASAPPPPPGKFTLSRAVHAPPPPAAAAAPSAAGTPASAAPPPMIQTPQVSAAALRAMTSTTAPGEFNLAKGIIGGVIGSILGASCLIGFKMMAGFSLPITGLLIGVATGWGARIMYKGTDYSLGIICGVIALVVVVPTMLWLYGFGAIMSIMAVVGCVYLAYNIASG